MVIRVWGNGSLAERVSCFIKDHTDDHVFDWDSDPVQDNDFSLSCQHDTIFNEADIEVWGPIINIHYSDTRMLRGCNVVSHAIAAAHSETAVTFHYVDKGIDTGPVITMVPVPISPTDTAERLYNRCENVAVGYLVHSWHSLRNLPEGTMNKERGLHFSRDNFTRELELGHEQRNFVRSRLFTGKPKPYIVIGDKEYEIG